MLSLSRYSSLSEAHRQAFGSEEDTLLSLVLHNLLVYMLMVGLSPEETTDLIHRLMARTQLATADQQTLKHVEQNVREGGGAGVPWIFLCLFRWEVMQRRNERGRSGWVGGWSGREDRSEQMQL